MIIFPRLSQGLSSISTDYCSLLKAWLTLFDNTFLDPFETMCAIQFMSTLLNKKNLYMKSKQSDWNTVRFKIVVKLSAFAKTFGTLAIHKQLNKRIIDLASKLVN